MQRNILLAALLLLGVAQDSASAQGRPGSIFNPDRDGRSPIADKTAFRLGDIVSVLISENQDISAEESTGLTRSSSLDAQISDFNLKPNLFNPLPSLQGDSASAFSGNANYSKAGSFSARLAAVVVDVLPNGNLVLSGRREIRIDNETKLIEFTGMVRRYDIAADNTVQSELVANSEIVYRGHGPLTTHTNRTGFSSAFFNFFAWIWPF